VHAAETVCAVGGKGEVDVLNGLDRLADRSLVHAEPGRYRLLETVRQYATARLQQGGQMEALRERHAEYYMRLAEVAEPELKRAHQSTWLDQLEIEHHNLRAALRWSIDTTRVTSPPNSPLHWRGSGKRVAI